MGGVAQWEIKVREEILLTISGGEGREEGRGSLVYLPSEKEE